MADNKLFHINKMDITLLSDHYHVRRMKENDISEIYALCRKNTLYYRYCPPFVTEESIADDMKALPPNKDYTDKYYIGYYDAVNEEFYANVNSLT